MSGPWNTLELFDYPRAMALQTQARQGDERNDILRQQVEQQGRAIDQRDVAAQAKERATWITDVGAAILSAAPADRPRLWDMAIQDGTSRGYDLSSVPKAYDSAAEGYLKFYMSKAQAIKAMLKPQGGGGGPATGGGWSNPPAAGGRVSDAAPGAGPVVAQAMPAGMPTEAPPGPAGAPVPPTGPTMAGGPPVAPQPSAGPVGMPPAGPTGALGAAPPGPPQIAPTQTAGMQPPQPPQAPQVVSPNMQYSMGADGDSVVGQDGGGEQRMFKIPAGHQVVLDNHGKVMSDLGGIWMMPVDAKGQRAGPNVLFFPPTRAAPRERQAPQGYEPDPDNPNTLRPIKGGPADVPREQWQDVIENGKVIAQRNSVTGAYKPIERQPDGKPLDNAARDDLRKAGAPAVELRELVQDFKPEYGGFFPGVGSLSNQWKMARGDDTGQAQWWQRYAATANDIRHGLFGSALTANEQAAFDAAMVTPRMDPKQIATNLSRQRDILMRGAARQAQGMIAGGMKADAVEKTLGIRLKDLPDPLGDVSTSDAPKGDDLPPDAAKQLKEGVATRFGNGQTWTLRDGKRVRLN